MVAADQGLLIEPAYSTHAPDTYVQSNELHIHHQLECLPKQCTKETLNADLMSP